MVLIELGSARRQMHGINAAWKRKYLEILARIDDDRVGVKNIQ